MSSAHQAFISRSQTFWFIPLRFRNNIMEEIGKYALNINGRSMTQSAVIQSKTGRSKAQAKRPKCKKGYVQIRLMISKFIRLNIKIDTK